MTATLDHTLIRASAGSGKTHQLTNRYLQLLANGVEPQRILATTFTRKAAGEILDRVLSRLAGAASAPSAATKLGQEIQAADGSQGFFVTLLRGLLQQLHRIRISTLDSFYITLASNFVNELGLPPGWSICEEADEALMRREALERVLNQRPDDISRLLALLTKGKTKRSIQSDLEQSVADHYMIFRSTSPAAWTALHVPPPVPETDRQRQLAALRQFDLSKIGDKRFAQARDKDVERFEQCAFEEFISTGLAGKIQTAATHFHKKPIPAAVAALYAPLLRHARHELLRPSADQNRATWELLAHYDREIRTLQQAHGGMRFDAVTQALVDATGRNILTAEALTFRLDGGIDHLLLDEFQDTSLAQWRVLEPLARTITAAEPSTQRAFFCVGDVKQAIYGWRGGLAAIFDRLPSALTGIHQDKLSVSQRSAPPVIAAVNQVFGRLREITVSAKIEPGLAAWCSRFEAHTTVRENLSGYVCLESGPAQLAEEALDQHRGRHCRYVAEQIGAITKNAPGRTVGVLCRTHEALNRMIYELRQRRLDASEEGGNALTDSAAVELVLSLFTLMDHPSASVARYHVQHSPLAEYVPGTGDDLARRLRRDVLDRGYGPVALDWAQRLAPACDRRELTRLQQLVDMAFAFQARSSLRADDFVDWVRTQRTADSSAASVRVMTMHAAKGLQFDIVVLPELDGKLVGRPPAVIVGRDGELTTNFVCPYIKSGLQTLLQADERRAFADWTSERVQESLALLYVAMTRAIHALYMYVPGERRREQQDACHQVLCQTLANGSERGDCRRLFEIGSGQWQARAEDKATSAQTAAAPRPRLQFKPPLPLRRRGLERLAPSRREGGGVVSLQRLLEPGATGGLAYGTLLHAWFALIEWLDRGPPERSALWAAAQRLQDELPNSLLANLEPLCADFLAMLKKPEIARILSTATYVQRPPQRVECERAFVVADGKRMLTGSIDRIVWFADGAEVLDYKTDAIADEAALATKVEFYRPQLETYRRAVALMAQLPETSVTLQLVFTGPGRVVVL